MLRQSISFSAHLFDVQECFRQIIRFAGRFAVRFMLQVSKRYADDSDCRNIAHNGEIILSCVVHSDLYSGDLAHVCPAETFDSYTRAWKQFPSSSFPYNGPTIAILDGFLYSFGGYSCHGGIITNNVNRLDLTDGNTWQERSPMLSCKIGFGLSPLHFTFPMLLSNDNCNTGYSYFLFKFWKENKPAL